MSDWMNRPRWVRELAGRSQSRNPTARKSATHAAPRARTLRQVRAIPRIERVRTANPGIAAGGPPPSAPQKGAPSMTIVTSPMIPTVIAAARGPRAGRISEESAVVSSRAAVTKIANVTLPTP